MFNDYSIDERRENARLMGMIFLFVLVGLFITGAVATGVAALFTYALPINEGNNFDIYFWTMIGSAVALFIMVIWVQVGVLRRPTKWMIIPYIFYAVIMGIFLSSFTMFIDFYVIGVAFGITCLCFGTMALVGYFSKANLNYLLFVIIALFAGGTVLALVNLLFYFVLPIYWDVTYWIITFVFFAVIMLVTCFDVYNIKQIIERGQMSGSLALYCAFTLYVDFIYLFIRILLILIMAKR